MRRVRRIFAVGVVVTLAVPHASEAQIWKRVTQVAACAGGAVAGVKLGDKIAEIEAQKLNLAPEIAAQHRRAFQIGMALALCGGGAALAGTAYSGLSKRGKEARQKEILAALEDAQPHTYTDPENTSLTGTATAQPSVVEGDQECRIVQDQLAADSALIKYCRPPGGTWSVKTV